MGDLHLLFTCKKNCDNSVFVLQLIIRGLLMWNVLHLLVATGVKHLNNEDILKRGYYSCAVRGAMFLLILNGRSRSALGIPILRQHLRRCCKRAGFGVKKPMLVFCKFGTLFEIKTVLLWNMSKNNKNQVMMFMLMKINC